MAAKKIQDRNLVDNIEKVLIVLILISIISYYIVTGERELKTGYLYYFVLLCESILVGYYIYLTRNLYSLFLIGYIILNVGFFLQVQHNPLGKKLILTGEFCQLFIGILFGYRAFLESKKNRDWEMFGTLLALVLMFPIIYRYLLSGKELLIIYHYALPFLIGIIIYNENLWDKYNGAEKKVLIYILVCNVAEVLFLSLNLV
jgi:hypothetical protein